MNAALFGGIVAGLAVAVPVGAVGALIVMTARTVDGESQPPAAWEPPLSTRSTRAWR